jgi:hypothetical protein
MWACAQKIF